MYTLKAFKNFCVYSQHIPPFPILIYTEISSSHHSVYFVLISIFESGLSYLIELHLKEKKEYN